MDAPVTRKRASPRECDIGWIYKNDACVVKEVNKLVWAQCGPNTVAPFLVCRWQAEPLLRTYDSTTTRHRGQAQLCGTRDLSWATKLVQPRGETEKKHLPSEEPWRHKPGHADNAKYDRSARKASLSEADQRCNDRCAAGEECHRE